MFFSAVNFFQFLVIKILDPDPGWVRMGIQPKILDPILGPYQMNTDPKRWNLLMKSNESWPLLERQLQKTSYAKILFLNTI